MWMGTAIDLDRMVLAWNEMNKKLFPDRMSIETEALVCQGKLFKTKSPKDLAVGLGHGYD